MLHALAGDLSTAESIDLTPTGSTVFARHMTAVAEAVLAVLAGRRDEAERLVASITARTSSNTASPLPTSTASCSMRPLAVDTGDLRRPPASSPPPAQPPCPAFRWEASYMLYRHCLDIIRSSLDDDTTARCRAQGETRSTRQVLLELVTE